MAMLLPCTVRKPATTHHSPSHPMMASEVIMSLPTWKSLTVATHTTARTRAPTPRGRTRAPTRAPIRAHTQEVPIWVSNMGNYGQTNCRMFCSATNHGFIQLFLNGTGGYRNLIGDIPATQPRSLVSPQLHSPHLSCACLRPPKVPKSMRNLRIGNGYGCYFQD